MSADLHDLYAALESRAAATPLEIAAARARLEARLTEPAPLAVAPRSAPAPRRSRRFAVALVAAAVVALVASVVALTTAGSARPDQRGPALGADGALALTQWLFTVQPVRLPTRLSVVEYVHADAGRQVAAVLSPQDAASSNHYSAVVELAADPATLGVATRPADARSVGPDAWTSPQTDAEFGVSGVQLVWMAPSGYTLRVVAGDGEAAQTVRDATDVDGWEHPVRFPMKVDDTWFPAGSSVRSFDFVGVQGASVVVDVPGAPAERFSVAASGVYVNNAQPGATTRPFGSGFAAIGPSSQPVRELTSPVVDLAVNFADERSATDTLPVDRLHALLAGSRFVGMADQHAWFPLADGFPTG